MTVLETERLRLTPAAETDFADLRALWGDADFVRPLFPAPLTGEDVWTRLLRDIGHWSARGYGNWNARLKTTGELVGSVGVLDYQRELIPPLDAPELGWAVATRFQGQGMAREAALAALHWCDNVLRASRTQCIIDPDNAPSLGLAARLGYRPLRVPDFRGKPIQVLERMRP